MYPALDSPEWTSVLTRSEFRDTPVPGVFANGRQRALASYLGPRTPYNALLLYHPVGTGKTCTAVVIAERHTAMQQRVLIVTQNTTLANVWRRELLLATGEKYLSPRDRQVLVDGDAAAQKAVIRNARERIKKDYAFVTYARLHHEIGQAYGVVIVDEAHHVTGERLYHALRILLVKTGAKFVACTATPTFDKATDILPLARLIALVNRREVAASDCDIAHIPVLLRGAVSRFERDAQSDCLPRVTEHEVMCPFLDGGIQQRLYAEASHSGLSLQEEYDEEIQHLSPSLQAMHKLSRLATSVNTSYLRHTPLDQGSSKFARLVEFLTEQLRQPGNIFINVFYIDEGGLSTLRYVLATYVPARILVMVAKMDSDRRSQVLAMFNHASNIDGSYAKIFLGTTSSSEGLTLKHVRFVHILNPAWNLSRYLQTSGRAVRYNALSGLPVELRTVDVYCYMVPDTIDTHKRKLSLAKNEECSHVHRLLCEVAVDKGWHAVETEGREQLSITHVAYLAEIEADALQQCERQTEFLYDNVPGQRILKTEIKRYLENQGFTAAVVGHLLEHDKRPRQAPVYSQGWKRTKIAMEDVSVKAVVAPVATVDPRPLSEEDRAFNDELVARHLIYGSYRKRPTVLTTYGIHDGVFRIVWRRDLADAPTESVDRRRVQSGVAAVSVSLSDMRSILRELGVQSDLSKTMNKVLIQQLQDILASRNLILR